MVKLLLRLHGKTKNALRVSRSGSLCDAFWLDAATTTFTECGNGMAIVVLSADIARLYLKEPLPYAH